MSLYIGIDPGKTGAIAIFNDLTPVDVIDMPVTGPIVSGQLLADMVRAVGIPPVGSMAIVEDVHAMPKQGVTSSFSFGRSLGVAEGVLAGAGWPITYVAPSRWKKALGLTADKGVARRRAIEQWPASGHLFARAKDDGRAEAALLVHWWLTHGR